MLSRQKCKGFENVNGQATSAAHGRQLGPRFCFLHISETLDLFDHWLFRGDRAWLVGSIAISAELPVRSTAPRPRMHLILWKNNPCSGLHIQLRLRLRVAGLPQSPNHEELGSTVTCRVEF